jgi:ATP-dependent DNA helicase RecQ
MQKLCIKKTVTVIVDSPDRSNIKISVQKMKNNVDVEDTFQWLMTGLMEKKQDFPRHIIFCNSIKDCASIYMLFFRNCEQNLFNMYHSKTTEKTKESIRVDMGNPNGLIRVLICTNAAGMGVNFQNLSNIVHYGPPWDLDTLVQQMGRAGRDGAMSHELIIYKSNQLRRVDDDVLKLVKSSTECRRKILNDAYMQSYTKICEHLCCDVCELLCQCESASCPSTHPSKDCLVNISVTEEHQMRREVGAEEEAILKQRLASLRDSMMEGMKAFIYGDIICGFNVDEIISNLPILFTVDDILDKTAIVSFSLAEKIITIINEIFGDVDMYMFVSQVDGSDSE